MRAYTVIWQQDLLVTIQRGRWYEVGVRAVLFSHFNWCAFTLFIEILLTYLLTYLGILLKEELLFPVLIDLMHLNMCLFCNKGSVRVFNSTEEHTEECYILKHGYLILQNGCSHSGYLWVLFTHCYCSMKYWRNWWHTTPECAWTPFHHPLLQMLLNFVTAINSDEIVCLNSALIFEHQAQTEGILKALPANPRTYIYR